MDAGAGRGTAVNSFALVSYITGPLGRFFDEVRHDFGPDTRAKAHVTILTPRQLASVEPAWGELRMRLQDFQPFLVEIGDVEVFEETQVVYASIKTGFPQLERMHRALNTGLVACAEPYPYHPHVTLAQELALEDVANAAAFAAWRWSQFEHSRSFMLDRLTFVQHTVEKNWDDLATLDLARQAVR